MGLRTITRRNYYRFLDLVTGKENVKWELKRVAASKRSVHGFAHIFDKPFKFHDGTSFALTYKDIFQNEIYKFHPSKTSNVILDCGANMGLSVLYFSLNYPGHHIFAFEPEQEIFEILQENVATFGLTNVTLFKKAVWDKKETLQFFSDGAMGGRVESVNRTQRPIVIEAVPLMDYLHERVDFLKIDIEGAETRVIKSCAGHLSKANHIFFEYHSDITKAQMLDELLLQVKEEGFTYHIGQSSSRQRPFVDTTLFCDQFDMNVNVFCIRK